MKDVKGKLANIASQQEARRAADELADLRDKPDTDERLELARVEEGLVRGPTRAEIVVALWRAFVFAPWPGLVIGQVSAGAGPPLGLKLGVSLGAGAVVALAIASLVWKLRERHVEHVRVRVFERGDFETKLYVPVTILYLLAALKWLL